MSTPTFHFLFIEYAAAIVDSMLLLCIFIPPNTGWQQLKQDLISVAQQCKDYCHSTKRTLIMGDFNLNYNQQQQLSNIMKTIKLKQLIENPTHELG